jgi:hypothetical protein
MPYRITQPDVSHLESELVRLWSQNLRMQTAPHSKYLWYYCNNPLGRASTFVVESSDDLATQIVGSCGIAPRVVYVHGVPRRAGLLADFTVDKAHRTLLPALMLQRAMAAHAAQNFDFAYAYPNASAVGIFSRIGYQLLGRSGRYVRLLRASRFAHRVIPVKPLADTAGSVADFGLRIVDRVRARRGRSRLRLDLSPRIDERFDRLFESVRGRYTTIGERSAQFLQWRFLDRPGVNGRIAALLDTAGDVRAYAALTDKEPGTVLLADFLALTLGDLGILLDRLAPVLRDQGYHSVLTYFLGATDVADALTARSYRFRGPGKYIVINSGTSVTTETLKDTGGWYLTEADRDN